MAWYWEMLRFKNGWMTFMGALTWTNFEAFEDNFLDEDCDKSEFDTEDWEEFGFEAKYWDKAEFEVVDCDTGVFKDRDCDKVGFEVVDLVTYDLRTEDWEAEPD